MTGRGEAGSRGTVAERASPVSRSRLLCLAHRRSRYHRLVKRSLAWVAGIVGIAALGRMLSKRKAVPDDPAPSAITTGPAPPPRRSRGGASSQARGETATRHTRNPGGRGGRDAQGEARSRPCEGARGDRRDERRGGCGVTATEATAHGREPDPALTDVVRELSDRIEALQADVRRLGGPGLPVSEPGWNDEPDDPAAAPSFAWVSAVGAPVRRRPTVPPLLLEVLFLAGVASAAAIAEPEAAAIAAVMAGAWLLVALSSGRPRGPTATATQFRTTPLPCPSRRRPRTRRGSSRR